MADARGFIHLGSNIEQEAQNPLNKGPSERSISTKRNRQKRLCSRLFLWTSALLVTPLLVTSFVISGLVYYQTRLKFERQLETVESTFMELRRQGLSTQAKLRAEVVSSMVQVSVRDLYVLTRYYSWLLFGGVNRADTFTELLTGVEECKTYSDDYSQCPFVQDTYTCDCSWNDRLEETCQSYPDGSRRLQKVTFAVESANALSDGDRNFSSYPRNSTSPETTAWWEDVTSVPGSENDSSAAGYDTLYDRLRVASAMPLFPVLYNYDPQKTNYIAQYVGFEADGLIIAYSGCDIQTVRGSGWKSTEENSAATVRPDLCPLGKYGYDIRYVAIRR
jgi:hypothetical protein